MGCCGEPNDGHDSAQTQITQYPNTINQQPSPHPGLEKSLFQQPSILPPPAIHQQVQPGTLQSMTWTQNSSPPPVDQFGGYTPSTSPLNQHNLSKLNDSFSMNEPLMRPGSAHHPTYGTGSPPPNAQMSMTSSYPMFPPPKTTSPPPDEGKMSISIDFGECLSSSCMEL